MWWEIQYMFYYNFPQVYHYQKLSKLAQDRPSYWKNKKGAVFFETQVYNDYVHCLMTDVSRHSKLTRMDLAGYAINNICACRVQYNNVQEG